MEWIFTLFVTEVTPWGETTSVITSFGVNIEWTGRDSTRWEMNIHSTGVRIEWNSLLNEWNYSLDFFFIESIPMHVPPNFAKNVLRGSYGTGFYMKVWPWHKVGVQKFILQNVTSSTQIFFCKEWCRPKSQCSWTEFLGLISSWHLIENSSRKNWRDERVRSSRLPEMCLRL